MVVGEGSALSGVDSDNLAAASADQEDPVETLGEDLEELHVWERRVKETCRAFYNPSYIISFMYLTVINKKKLFESKRKRVIKKNKTKKYLQMLFKGTSSACNSTVHL